MRKPDLYIMTPRLPRQPSGPKNDVIELGMLTEEMGYDRVWIMETNDRDAFVWSSEIALFTKKIKIGTNIVSVYSRTPTLLAISTLTLAEIAGDRFVLGIGPGGTEILRDGHGIKLEKPLRRVRESIDIIRTLVKGERLNYEGQVFKVKRDFRLRIGVPEIKVPIYIAALNPKMIQLAGEKADGVILSHMPVEAAEDVKKNLEMGAQRSGRDPSEVEVCTNLPLAANREGAILNYRKAVAWHLVAPTYDWLISHTNYSETVTKMRKLWWEERSPEEASKLIDDDMLVTFGLGYKEEDIKSRLRKYLSADITPIADFHGITKGAEKEDIITLMKIVKSAV